MSKIKEHPWMMHGDENNSGEFGKQRRSFLVEVDGKNKILKSIEIPSKALSGSISKASVKDFHSRNKSTS